MCTVLQFTDSRLAHAGLAQLKVLQCLWVRFGDNTWKNSTHSAHTASELHERQHERRDAPPCPQHLATRSSVRSQPRSRTNATRSPRDYSKTSAETPSRTTRALVRDTPRTAAAYRRGVPGLHERDGAQRHAVLRGGLRSISLRIASSVSPQHTLPQRHQPYRQFRRVNAIRTASGRERS